MYWPAPRGRLARAVRQLAVPQVAHRAREAPQARLRRPVGVVEPGLPAVEVRLVERVEDEQPADRGLAVGDRNRLAVVRGLRRGADTLLGVRRVAQLVREHLLLRHRGLDAELRVDDG